MKLPIGNGIVVKAYYALQFSTNFVSVGLLQVKFEVLFSETICNYSGCLLMKKGKIDVIHEVKLKNGLYPLARPKMYLNLYQATLAIKPADTLDNWHRNLGHLSADRINLVHQNANMLPFNRDAIIHHECVACLVGKAKL